MANVVWCFDVIKGHGTKEFGRVRENDNYIDWKQGQLVIFTQCVFSFFNSSFYTFYYDKLKLTRYRVYML